MKYNLYEIEKEIAEVIEKMECCVNTETGELENEDVYAFLQETLERLLLEKEEYLDEIVKEIKNREAIISALKEEKMNLQDRQKQHERMRDKMKEFLKEQVKFRGGKVKTDLYTAYVSQRNKIEKVDMEKLDDIYKIIEYRQDRKKINEALKNGNDVNGVTVGEIEYINIRYR